MKAPSLTLVVPVYNRAGIVERSLDCIAAQTLRPLSLIIVDNNSTDNTAEVIERWADAHRSSSFDITVTRETRPGAAAARRRGLELVSTPIVQFFDSDDIMAPTLAADIVNAFAARPELELLGWDTNVQAPDGSRRINRFRVDDRTMYRALVHGMLSTQRYAALTSLVRRAGSWRPDIRVWNDMELSTRIVLLNPVMQRLDVEAPVTTIFTADSITHGANSTPVSSAKEHTLDVCYETMLEAGHREGQAYVNYRRACLAAEYASAGAHTDARRLMSQLPVHSRWRYRLIYLKHRLCRRGTWLLRPPLPLKSTQ
ncbi:MAG: glycosyltransferase family 2 protein [Bacteroides sp.]|nr:glycosyltransferase family 2 protein [Bacteroides sp.]